MPEDMTEFAEMERELAALRPAEGVAARRDAVLFEAGRAAGRRSALRWRGAAGVMMLLTAGMVAMLWTGHGQWAANDSVAEQKVAPAKVEPVAANTAAAGTMNDDDEARPARRAVFGQETYIGLRNEVLVHGVGVLPRDSGGVRDPAVPVWQRRVLPGGRS